MPHACPPWMKRGILLALAASSLQAAGHGRHRRAWTEPPPAFRACLLQDWEGHILHAERAGVRIEPASLTKLMTAYVVFQGVREGRLAWDQSVRVSGRAASTEGSRAGLAAGERLTVGQLAEALLVVSGNDAAVALAEAFDGSEAAFVAHMNREAQALGLAGTRFCNPHGLTCKGHYSTAADLAVLARRLWEDFPERRPIYAEQEYARGAFRHRNRNELLHLDARVDGLKTGYTAAAGFNLVFTAQGLGQRILGVLVGTPSNRVRTREALRLLAMALPPQAPGK